VIQCLELHDELCSGKGFPNNRSRSEIPAPVRAFTLFNHFDAYRAGNTGTRRARLERTKETMQARAQDYDPFLWPLFWEFWERQVEAVT
jgi:response regulator RpfG family c-di-GMP phosphodiesterase